MRKKDIAIGILLLTAGSLAVAATRREALPVGGTDYGPQPFDFGAADFISSIEAWTLHSYQETEVNNMELPTPPSLETNIAAALATISQAEGTARMSDPYRVCYGYSHTIASFADHPAVTGEWRGKALPDDMCRNAGFSPGCVSTAAGKYQIVKPTWARLKSKLGLPDFSPDSQDAAAVELMRERGALVYLERGQFASAIAAMRKEWASLTGAGYGQGEKSIAWLTDRFTEAGGVLA